MDNLEKINILKENNIIPHDCQPPQVSYFFEVCERKKLDPFLKQIHLIERKSQIDGRWMKNYTIQAGIDGMRAIAQRSGQMLSCERGVKSIGNDLYGWCRLTKVNGGIYYDELPYSEYAQKTKEGKITIFWETKKETMIKKCAEESVLRMAFPEDLSGVYGNDEMMQADLIDTKEIKQLEKPKVLRPWSPEVLKDKIKTSVEIRDKQSDKGPISKNTQNRVNYAFSNIFDGVVNSVELRHDIYETLLDKRSSADFTENEGQVILNWLGYPEKYQTNWEPKSEVKQEIKILTFKEENRLTNGV